MASESDVSIKVSLPEVGSRNKDLELQLKFILRTVASISKLLSLTSQPLLQKSLQETNFVLRV